MSKSIYITQEVEIEMDEIETQDLCDEIEERGFYVVEKSQDIETEKEKLNALKEILGLKEWHTKKEIIKEIQQL